MRTLGLMMIVAATSFAGSYALMNPDGIRTAFASSDCNIKGNVSYNSGRRIYHMPGQDNYDETIISPDRGERWFCTEAEARAAGWLRAGY